MLDAGPSRDEWRLVLGHLDLIEQLAWAAFRLHRFAVQVEGYEQEDLRQAMILEAYKVAQRYDPERGAAFSTLLVHRLRGLPIDLLYRARRSPTAPRELRSTWGMSTDGVGPDGEQLQVIDGHDYIAEAQAELEIDELFSALWRGLSDREKVVMGHVVRGLPLREAGAALGVTESRACQIRGKLKQKVLEAVA